MRAVEVLFCRSDYAKIVTFTVFFCSYPSLMLSISTPSDHIIFLIDMSIEYDICKDNMETLYHNRIRSLRI